MDGTPLWLVGPSGVALGSAPRRRCRLQTAAPLALPLGGRGQGARLSHVSVPCRSQEPPQDSVIATYEEHEDSVYAVDWSSADPWLFASLSYDGRLVINRVPRALKYHILL